VRVGHGHGEADEGVRRGLLDLDLLVVAARLGEGEEENVTVGSGSIFMGSELGVLDNVLFSSSLLMGGGGAMSTGTGGEFDADGSEGLPNGQFPSDHLPLFFEVMLT
jgi:hypothetical protein